MTDTQSLAASHAGDTVTGGRFGLWLGLLTLLGLGVRVAYAVLVAPHAAVPGDARLFHLLAGAVAHGQGYSTETSLFAGHPLPTAEHPPLYVLYLALWVKLGLTSIDGQRVVSCLLGAAAVALIGLLGKRVAGPRAGLIAAGVAALYPQLFVVDGTLISESLYVPLIVASLLLAYRVLDQPSVVRAAGLGAAIGLATLTRPDGILLVPLLAAPVAWRATRGRRRLGLFGVCAAATALVLSPWLVRNEIALHRFPLISTNGALTAPAANCLKTFYGKATGFVEYGCALNVPACQGIVAEVPESECLEHQAVNFVLHHKRRVPIVVLARVARAFQLFDYNLDMYYAGVWGRPKGVATAGLIVYALLAPLAAGGVLLLRRRRVPLLPLVIPFLLAAIVTASSFGFSRYRIAADVALVVLAAVAVDALAERRLWRRGEPRAYARLAPDAG